MVSDSDKYLYFNVGLLKDSAALEELWKDALKHHMIDQPGKLIALRLTEYYEIMSKGLLPPVASVAIAAPPPVNKGSADVEQVHAANGDHAGGNGTGKMPRQGKSFPVQHQQIADARPDPQGSTATARYAEQNAEEAADYWTVL